MTVAIPNRQLQNGQIIPEVDISALSEATLRGYASLQFTNSKLTWDEFVAETGYTGPNPMAGIGQTDVLKCEFDGSTSAGVNAIADVTISTPIDITRGLVGMYVYISAADRNAMGPTGVRMYLSNGPVSSLVYNLFGMPVSDAYSSDTWGLCGGLDETGYKLAENGGPTNTAIDNIRVSMDGDSSPCTFYLMAPFYGAKRKPIFAISQDDGSDSYPESVGSSVGESGTHHLCDDCIERNLPVSINMIYTSPGNPGVGNINDAVINATDLKSYVDTGKVFMCMHGHSGMVTELTESEAMQQIDDNLSIARDFYPGVVVDEYLLHFALPLGQTSSALRDYCRSVGFRTVSRVGSTPIQGLTGQCAPNCIPDYLHLARYSIDGPISAGDAQSVIDHINVCLKHQQDILLYLHSFDNNRATLQTVLDYAQLQINRGYMTGAAHHVWYKHSIADSGFAVDA